VPPTSSLLVVMGALLRLISQARPSVRRTGGQYTLYGLGRTADDVALRCKSLFLETWLIRHGRNPYKNLYSHNAILSIRQTDFGWCPSIALQHLIATTGAGRYSPSQDSRTGIDQKGAPARRLAICVAHRRRSVQIRTIAASADGYKTRISLHAGTRVIVAHYFGTHRRSRRNRSIQCFALAAEAIRFSA
jgi:hypothetical protein